jgi:hypothetical protein
VSQISLPVRILLAGAVVFLAAWFTVLRPKAETVEPPATTPVATATATPAAAKTKSGSAVKPSATPAPDAPAIPAAALAKLPDDVAGALKARKTVVLGVIADGATELRPLADDDRYVRNALRHVNRYKGGVLVKTVPVGGLVTYAPIVGDLHVNQTPSVVVVDGDLKARVLAGYVDRISINQAIADARRATIKPLITDPYLRKLNAVCQQYVTSEDRWSWPTIDTRKAMVSALDRRVALEKRYHGVLVRTPAPARWRSLKHQFVTVQGRLTGVVAEKAAAIKHADPDAFAAADSGYWTPRRALDQRLDTLGVTSCVANRRS